MFWFILFQRWRWTYIILLFVRRKICNKIDCFTILVWFKLLLHGFCSFSDTPIRATNLCYGGVNCEIFCFARPFWCLEVNMVKKIHLVWWWRRRRRSHRIFFTLFTLIFFFVYITFRPVKWMKDTDKSTRNNFLCVRFIDRCHIHSIIIWIHHQMHYSQFPFLNSFDTRFCCLHRWGWLVCLEWIWTVNGIQVIQSTSQRHRCIYGILSNFRL